MYRSVCLMSELYPFAVCVYIQYTYIKSHTHHTLYMILKFSDLLPSYSTNRTVVCMVAVIANTGFFKRFSVLLRWLMWWWMLCRRLLSIGHFMLLWRPSLLWLKVTAALHPVGWGGCMKCTSSIKVKLTFKFPIKKQIILDRHWPWHVQSHRGNS